MEATINTETLDAYVSSLPNATQRRKFLNNVQRLTKLVDESSNAKPLPEFLAEFGQLVAELYAATAVAIWFQSPGAANPSLKRKVNVGWSNLRLDRPSEEAHALLLDYAMKLSQQVAVKPFSAPAPRAGVSNPTDSFLLLAPVKYEQQDIAILEIALGPKPLRSPHEQLMSSYLDWMTWLGQLLQRGIERSFAKSGEPMLLALETLQLASVQAEQMQDQIRQQIEASLKSLAGKNFGTLIENQTIAKQVHALLDSKGLRVVCPECKAAAILRCQKAGNSKTGAFMFDHYLDTGRTFHGGQATFPELSLTPKPARRQQSK